MNYNKKVALIPLDTRPCNYEWIKRLVDVLKIDLKILEKTKSGTLYNKTNTKDAIKFLIDNFSKVDYFIISIDASIFGGLIQARDGKVDFNEANEFFNVLTNLKKTYPKTKVYVFDTLMRTSITTKNALEAKFWALMNEYSKHTGLYYFFKKEEDKIKIKYLEQIIPKNIIDTYLLARKNKHQINLQVLKLVKSKIIDDEILLQEDSMPYGIQQIEQQVLNDYIKANSLDNVKIFNGTDEGALIYLSKIVVNDLDDKDVYCYIPNESLKSRVHLFEDKPFEYNLEQMAKKIGINLSYIDTNQNVMLAIYGEKQNTDLDISKYVKMPLDIKISKPFVDYINHTNKKTILVDLKYPNGGSVELLNEIDLSKLSGYSAWNTSSNSLGSAFLMVAINLLKVDNKCYKKFVNERILDDCYYQSYARRKANEILLNEGINIYDLNDKTSYAISLIKKFIDDVNNLNVEYSISLPWDRTFECDIEILEKEGK